MTKLHAAKMWFDRGKMIEVTDDVMNVVRDIHALSDRITVYYNEQSNEFDIVERTSPVEEQLVFSTPTLDPRVVERLRAADHWYGQDVPTHILSDDEDFAAQMDAENAKLAARNTELARDRIRDAGERLAWALDICHDRSSVGGSISVPRSIHGSDDKR